MKMNKKELAHKIPFEFKRSVFFFFMLYERSFFMPG